MYSNINKASQMIGKPQQELIKGLLEQINSLQPIQIKRLIEGKFKITPILQRELMINMLSRADGVTVLQAMYEGVKSPSTQIQELKKRGYKIDNIREVGKCKKAIYHLR
jgi:hypothetical protein